MSIADEVLGSEEGTTSDSSPGFDTMAEAVNKCKFLSGLDNDWMNLSRGCD